MPSKEHLALVEKVARDLATLNEGTEDTWENYHADAQKACSTIRAALQEPTEGMIETMCAAQTHCKWPDDFGLNAQAFRREQARYAFIQALAASALGEQSDG